MSIFENYPLGEIIRNRVFINVDGISEIKYELVDGQQRITTIIKFMNDEIALTDEDSRKIISDFLPYFEKSKSTKNIEKALTKFYEKEKLALKYKSLPTQLQEKIKTCSLSVRTLEVEDSDYILEYFRRVQSGKRLTNEDMVHTVVNQLTDKTKEFSTNKKILNLFDFVFESGEEKKDASRKINLCVLEMISLFCDGRDMGVPKDLWKWVNEQPSSELKPEHSAAISTIKEFFSTINTDNKKLSAGKTEIKLILSLILYGYNELSGKLGFDINNFANLIFNIALVTKSVKTFNMKRTPDSEEKLISNLKEFGLFEYYQKNPEAFNNFALLRAGSHPQDEVKKFSIEIINLLK